MGREITFAIFGSMVSTLAPSGKYGVTDNNASMTSQQRYLPFGQVRADVASPNSQSLITDYGYTGQRNLDEGIGLMDYRARFRAASPVLTRFIQPDTIVPGMYTPQMLNRFSYVGNNPINFNDPSGHVICEADGSFCFDPQMHTTTGNLVGNGCNGCWSPLKPKDEILNDEVVVPSLNPQQNIVIDSFDVDSIFSPFGNNQQVLYCQTNRCDLKIPDVPGEYRIDWSRVDGMTLTIDLAGLGLSIVGLGSVSKVLKINSQLEKGGLRAANFVTNTTSVSHSIETNDAEGIYLTAMGIVFPPLNIGTSALAVLNDLSSAIYFVPYPPMGPPAP